MARKAKHDLHKPLKEIFGFDHFKERQEEIINCVMNGKDCFVIMPTGGGKSLCYQLPAMLMEGTAIIISPLIALMKNQVDSVRNFTSEESTAHVYNSSLSRPGGSAGREDKNALYGAGIPDKKGECGDDPTIENLLFRH